VADTLAVGAYHEASCSTSITTAASADDSCGEAGAVYVYVRSKSEPPSAKP
jgi:hypothetical protein